MKRSPKQISTDDLPTGAVSDEHTMESIEKGFRCDEWCVCKKAKRRRWWWKCEIDRD